MKKEPWRIIIGVLSIIFIVFLWIKKDISLDMDLSLMITTLAVSLTKIIVFAGIILLIKYGIRKMTK